MCVLCLFVVGLFGCCWSGVWFEVCFVVGVFVVFVGLLCCRLVLYMCVCVYVGLCICMCVGFVVVGWVCLGWGLLVCGGGGVFGL